jgi:hypothetical protein
MYVTDWVWIGCEMKIKLTRRGTSDERLPYLSFKFGRLKVRERNQYKRTPVAI